MPHAPYYGLAVPFILRFAEHKIPGTPKSLRLLAACISCLFTQTLIIGKRFYFNHNWSDCFDSPISIVLWLLQSICYGYIFYRICLCISCIIEEHRQQNSQQPEINLRRWFWIILAGKVPYFAAFYPCIFGFDAAVGLRTLLDPNCAACNHHPYFVQLLHALAFSFGQQVGHSSWGFALLTLAFCIVSSQIVVYGLRLLSDSGLSHRWLTVMAAIYAFFPLFSYLSVYTTKDGFFAYALLLYIYNVYEMWLSHAQCLRRPSFLLLHGVAILTVCLTRHQGIYLILPVCILQLWLYRESWRRLLLPIAPALLCFIIFSKCLLPHYNVEPGGKQEMYGMLFQQTAYCLIQHPQDVTADEREAIGAILDEDIITEKYRFYISDPVKRTYKYNPWFRPYVKGLSQFRHVDHSTESAEFNRYLSAWFSMGCRHPLTYLQASVANVIGFFYDMGDPLIEIEPFWAENGSATTSEYTFFHVNRAAAIYFNRIYQWLAIPFVGWLLAIPYYNWIVILLLCLLLYRRDFVGLSVFLPVLLSLAVLLICPVAYGRYMYPIVAALPFLVSYLVIRRSTTAPSTSSPSK